MIGKKKRLYSIELSQSILIIKICHNLRKINRFHKDRLRSCHTILQDIIKYEDCQKLMMKYDDRSKKIINLTDKNRVLYWLILNFETAKLFSSQRRNTSYRFNLKNTYILKNDHSIKMTFNYVDDRDSDIDDKNLNVSH